MSREEGNLQVPVAVQAKTSCADSPSDFSLAGQKRTPRRGEQQGWSDSRGTEVTLERAERRPYRESRPYETERQADFTPEKFTDEKYVLQALVCGGTGLRVFSGSC